jgi:hypothetical protein
MLLGSFNGEPVPKKRILKAKNILDRYSVELTERENLVDLSAIKFLMCGRIQKTFNAGLKLWVHFLSRVSKFSFEDV